MWDHKKPEQIHDLVYRRCVVAKHGHFLISGPALYVNITAYYSQIKTEDLIILSDFV